MAAPLAALALTACATAPEPGQAPYVAIYTPLQARPGEILVSSTAALDGRLAVVGGCFSVVADSGVPVLVAFRPQVQVVRSGGRYGLLDTETGRRAFPGDEIGVGGASAHDVPRFIDERLASPPPAGCPTNLFVSNAAFGKR
jgi:hypothetical protein